MKLISVELWHSWFALYLNGELHEVKHADALCCQNHADFQQNTLNSRVTRDQINIWADELAEDYMRGAPAGATCQVVVRSHSQLTHLVQNIGVQSGDVFGGAPTKTSQ